MSGDVKAVDAAPDVGSPPRPRPRDRAGSLVPVLAVISAGGGIGAEARYAVGLAMPTVPGHVPWGTFLINVLGCFLIGVLMVLITEVWSPHRLLRPFLGVGVLGGFTTFSTYANEVRGLLRPESALTAVGYLAGTLVCALLATVLAMGATRLATTRLARLLRRGRKGSA